MSESEIIEPDDDNINEKVEIKKILDNHIKNTVLLFNFQSKFNNEINKKLGTVNNSNVNTEYKLLDKTLNNHILLLNINNKLNTHVFFNYIFMGISVIALGIIIIKKLKQQTFNLLTLYQDVILEKTEIKYITYERYYNKNGGYNSSIY